MDYNIYVADTETTGLDSRKHDVIEFSIINTNTKEQKTWFIKPSNIENINLDSLRINKHKYEDITHQTEFGRSTYQEASKVIVEIENWLLEDNLLAEKRVLCGSNIQFDLDMLRQLWIKAGSEDSFPFGRRALDLQGIEFFLNLCEGKMLEGYSQNNIIKKYGIKNANAHTAAADTKAANEILEAQMKFFKKALQTKFSDLKPFSFDTKSISGRGEI